MITRISASQPPIASSTSTSTAEQTTAMKQVDPQEGSLADKNRTIGSPGISSITSLSSETSSISPEEIATRYKKVTGNLAPFLVVIDEKNFSQIFTMESESRHIELEEQVTEQEGIDSPWKNVNPAHDAAKEFFVDQLKELYGERAVSVLYPESERDEPLTLGKAQDLLKSFMEVQDAVIAACDNDLSTYDIHLASQLSEIETLKDRIANPTAMNPKDASYLDFVSMQTGMPSWMLHALLITGSVVLVTGATGGISLIPALHAAMTTACHSAALGVAGGSHLAVTAHAATATTMSAGSIASSPFAAAPIEPASVVQTVTGLAGKAHSMASSVTAALGPYSSTIAAVGTGAAGGAVRGAMYASGTQEKPATANQVIGGMLAGAVVGGLLGGLSEVYGAITVGGTVAGVMGGYGAIGGMIERGQTGGASGVLSGALKGAAPGLVLGGQIALFGGLCGAVAAHAATAPIGGSAFTATETYTGIALGTATAAYVANPTPVNNAASHVATKLHTAVTNLRGQPSSDASSNPTGTNSQLVQVVSNPLVLVPDL